MIKNILVLVACIAIVALSWAFYAFFGKYVFSIYLTLLFISILANPVESKFGQGKESSILTENPISKESSHTSERTNDRSDDSDDQQD